MHSSSFACTSREDFASSGERGRELAEEDAATLSSVIAPLEFIDVKIMKRITNLKFQSRRFVQAAMNSVKPRQLRAFDDAEVALRARAECLKRFLVSVALAGRQCDVIGIEFDNDSSQR